MKKKKETEKENEIVLKSCPFCNGKAIFNDNVCGTFVTITCDNCFCELSRNKKLHEDATADVINAWNRRYTDEAYDQRAAYVKQGNMFRHFKGMVVMIDFISQNTETGDIMVNYHHLGPEKDSQIWSRPLDMFLSKVDRTKYPDADQEYRFELLLDEKNDLPF